MCWRDAPARGAGCDLPLTTHTGNVATLLRLEVFYRAGPTAFVCVRLSSSINPLVSSRDTAPGSGTG